MAVVYQDQRTSGNSVFADQIFSGLIDANAEGGAGTSTGTGTGGEPVAAGSGVALGGEGASIGTGSGGDASGGIGQSATVSPAEGVSTISGTGGDANGGAGPDAVVPAGDGVTVMSGSGGAAFGGSSNWLALGKSRRIGSIVPLLGAQPRIGPARTGNQSISRRIG